MPMQERWLPRQRFYWSALTCVFENLPTRKFGPRYFDTRALHDRTKVAVGHIRHYTAGGEKLVITPDSTSFAAMPDEARFKSFVAEAFEFFANDLVSGLSLTDLRREAMRKLKQRN